VEAHAFRDGRGQPHTPTPDQQRRDIEPALMGVALYDRAQALAAS